MLPLLLAAAIFCCAQLGIMFVGPGALAVEIDARATADYGPWEYAAVAPVDPRIGTAIANDYATAPVSPAGNGDVVFLPTLATDEPTVTHTTTMTHTPTPSPSSTSTSTATATTTSTATSTSTNTPTATL
ncbi:MAG: hypothetical protein KC519_10705, partial [Anaerolineae bacterium]|nr:hypothetical protein [Anaerolineae bacterium]